jgi:hypothetical protein
MATPPDNGHGDGHSNGRAAPRDPKADPGQPNSTGIGPLIEEAEALKGVLHDAYGRAARLVAALRRQRKQSRLMASTLASLRQLQQIDP